VYTSPRNPSQLVVKRVIGLPGDVIQTLQYKDQYVTVPDGHCWVEGDNHGQSEDSNKYGPVRPLLSDRQTVRQTERLKIWTDSLVYCHTIIVTHFIKLKANLDRKTEQL
jgi:signal peptidase I